MPEEQNKYKPPTLEDVERIFGKENIGEVTKCRPPSRKERRRAKEVADYIRKLEEIYKETKNSIIQVD